MPDFAAPLQRLIDEFRRLPGVGQKSAQRLAFHVLRSARDDAARLANGAAGRQGQPGASAPSATTSAMASCAPTAAIRIRDRTQICVVEEPHNILPHRDHAHISPASITCCMGRSLRLRGIGPEQLKIKGLLDRIARGEAQEIILATNPTVEGEATAVYLSRLLKPLG